MRGSRLSDVFISYARSDSLQASAIAAALREAGYAVWIDTDLPVHRAFSLVIEEQLQRAKAVIVLWSEAARASRWVPAEADMAYNSDKLVQVTLDGTLPPLPFNRVHCERVENWDGNGLPLAWNKIVDSLGELIGGEVRQSGLVAPAPPPVVTARPVERLLAVLPFDNLSSDQELDYFCDGVSEEIQRTVSDGSALKVVARSSSFQFRGAAKDIAKVAAALGTSHLLDGSVRRGGERVRISAELVDCASGNAIWGDQFDGSLDDVFELQETIARKVAAALKVALPGTRAAEDRGLPPALFDLFVRARGQIADGDAVFDDSAKQAVPLIETVTEGAPHFAPAWELLAMARAMILRSGHFEDEYEPARDAVLHAATTALQLDAKRGGAHLALAMLEPWGAYRDRENRLMQALAVSPNDPAILNAMSNFCWTVGRFKDALEFAQRACELNPLMPAPWLHLAQMKLYCGDYEGGVRLNLELHLRWADNPGIMLSLLNTAGYLGFWDIFDEVVGDVDRYDGWQADDMRAAIAFNRANRNREPDKVAKRVGRYVELVEKTGTIPLNLILSIAELTTPDTALDVAEKASYDYIHDPRGDRPSSYYPGTILGPWSKVIENPRFVQLCEKLGLCGYWIDTGQWPDCISWAPYDFKQEAAKVHDQATEAPARAQ